MESEILKGLNDAQRAAVVGYDRPSLIIAGAGSGKTRVLTSRIAYMIEQGVKPYQILALTFTNKAAAEMRARIEQMIGTSSRYIRMGTFHSVFSRILRENADRIGYPQSFTIYEPNDVKNLLKTIVREMNLSDDKYKPNVLASRISQAKNTLITPGAYLARPACLAEDRQAQIPEFGNIYNEYCRRCKRNGAMDFDDLLLQTNILLKDCPDVLARYQELFRYILVDEYQDTNYAQYIIIRRLSQLHGMVCVVGDDAQSIYSFRGAKIENILSFQQDYPSAEVFKLEQNYRSTRTIVDAANSVITHNTRRMQKSCFSEGDRGEKIRILRAFNEYKEAELLVREIRDRQRSTNCNWSDISILYRTNVQSKMLEDSLRMLQIPYRIYGGMSFYDHKVIRDLLGYIRLIINPQDDEAFKRVINVPARGIGPTTLDRIKTIAEERGCSMWTAVDQLVSEPVTDAVQRAIVRKVALFTDLIRALGVARKELGPYDFAVELTVKSGITSAYQQDESPEAKSAIEWIDEFKNSIQGYQEQCDQEILEGIRDSDHPATIEEWLQNAMLMAAADKEETDNADSVTLMTIHSSKGLEYKYIYIAGLEDELFPSFRAIESPDDLEEERRLFYVALTRAKVAAVLTYAEMRTVFGEKKPRKPSRFLREIDPQYVESDVDYTTTCKTPEPYFDDEEFAVKRRFDYRLQRERQGDDARGSYGTGSGRYGTAAGSGRYGSASNDRRPGAFSENNRYGSAAGSNRYGNPSGGSRYGASSEGRQAAGSRFGNRPADGESGAARRFSAAADPYRAKQYPHPATRLDERLEKAVAALGSDQRRTLRAMPSAGAAGTAAPAPSSAGGYAVGDRVEHAIFGRGEIRRIEQQSDDLKLVVEFDGAGSKTLLARFAKLRKC